MKGNIALQSGVIPLESTSIRQSPKNPKFTQICTILEFLPWPSIMNSHDFSLAKSPNRLAETANYT